MTLMRRALAALLVAIGLCAVPVAANADPISAIAILITTSLPFVSAAVDTLVFYAVSAGLTLGLGAALTYASNALMGNRSSAAQTAAQAQQRQAQVTSMSIGEGPRQLIVGRAAVGGQLLDAFNWGGQYGTDNETLIIKLCDHRIDAVVGVYVDDAYILGAPTGAITGYSGQLTIDVLLGSETQVLPSYVFANSDWVSADNVAGCAVAIVTYTADAPDAQTPVWSGRPKFLFDVRGMPMYDPRSDSTAGGSGSQRRATPSTWVWSENAAVCHYNYMIGIFACDRVDQPDQLLVGRGLTDYEFPPARVFAAANLCDEIPTGEAAARYRVGGLLTSDQSYIDVEQMFADAMAGYIVQPNGAVDIIPGQALTPAFTFTDGDILSSETEQFSLFRSDSERVNSVTVTYIEPSQKWQSTTAGVQRSTTDIATDGFVRELTVTLPLVPFRVQAERIGKIRLLEARRERTATITLGPTFIETEAGDWVTWSSNKTGRSATYRVQQISQGPDWHSQLVLQETDFSVYGFGGDGVSIPTYAANTPPDALVLGHPAIFLIDMIGSDDSVIQAVRGTWDVPADPAILRVRLEIRDSGVTYLAHSETANVSGGQIVSSSGFGPNGTYQARLVPIGAPGRPIAPSAWVDFASGDLISSATKTFGGFTADELVTQLNLNADQIAAEILRGEAYRAYTDAILYLGGIDVGTYVVNQIDTFNDTISAYVSTVNLIGAKNLAGTAIILDGSTVYVDAVTSLSAKFSSIQSTFDGHSASITTLDTVTNGLEARHTVSLNVDGHVSGIELSSSGSTSSFIIVADQMALVDPGQVGVSGGVTGSQIPFSYSAGIVYLGTVYAQYIKADTIDVVHLKGATRSQSVISYTATEATFNTTADWTMASNTMTCRGGLVKVWFNASSRFVSGSNPATSFTGVSLKIDGTGQTEVPGPAHGIGTCISLVWVGTPSAGSHTFEIDSHLVAAGGLDTYGISNRFLAVEETIV